MKTVTCANQDCLAVFEQPENSNRGFCSQACRYASRRTPRVALNCLVCGKQFHLLASDIAWRTARYGKSAGLKKSEALKLPRPSKQQLRDFWTQELREAQERMKALHADPERRASWGVAIKKRSASDAWRAAKHFQKGEAHPNYNGHKTEREAEKSRYALKKWRVAVYARDNYTCRDCGQRGGRLNAHHVKSWAKHPELRHEVSNGETLCYDCHNKRHGLTRRTPVRKCQVCGADKKTKRGLVCRSCHSRNMRAKQLAAA